MVKDNRFIIVNLLYSTAITIKQIYMETRVIICIKTLPGFSKFVITFSGGGGGGCRPSY